MNLRDREDRRLERRQVAADDGLERLRQSDGDHDGIHGLLRHGAHGPRRPLISMSKLLEAAMAGPGVAPTQHSSRVRPVVERIDLVAGKALEEPILDHGPVRRRALFAG